MSSADLLATSRRTEKSASKIRIRRRYRAGRLDGPYDAIVIGSSPGGHIAEPDQR